MLFSVDKIKPQLKQDNIYNDILLDLLNTNTYLLFDDFVKECNDKYPLNRIKEAFYLIKNELHYLVNFRSGGYGDSLKAINSHRLEGYLMAGGYIDETIAVEQNKITNNRISERLEMLDRLINTLRKNKIRRYLTVEQLRARIAGLSLWSEEELLNDLSVLNNGIVEKKVKVGVEKFRYNRKYDKFIKFAQKASRDLKSDEELREFDTKLLEYKKLVQNVKFWKDPRVYWSFLSGGAAHMLITYMLKLAGKT